jgi:hypothetical protein
MARGFASPSHTHSRACSWSLSTSHTFVHVQTLSSPCQDDMGWGEPGLYPSTSPHGRISTPNLDKFGQEGIQFTHAYAGYTVCGELHFLQPFFNMQTPSAARRGGHPLTCAHTTTTRLLLRVSLTFKVTAHSTHATYHATMMSLTIDTCMQYAHGDMMMMMMTGHTDLHDATCMHLGMRMHTYVLQRRRGRRSSRGVTQATSHALDCRGPTSRPSHARTTTRCSQRC